MIQVWVALAVFVAMHLLAFWFVARAAQKTKDGNRRATWRYLFLGDAVARNVLSPEGLRLASIARRVSWLAFLLSAILLLFK